MKISEIITDKYKLRLPPTIYYELLADVVEAEDEQEPILDKIKTEIKKQQYGYMGGTDYEEGVRFGLMLAHQILDKYKAETEAEDGNVD